MKRRKFIIAGVTAFSAINFVPAPSFPARKFPVSFIDYMAINFSHEEFSGNPLSTKGILDRHSNIDSGLIRGKRQTLPIDVLVFDPPTHPHSTLDCTPAEGVEPHFTFLLHQNVAQKYHFDALEKGNDIFLKLQLKEPPQTAYTITLKNELRFRSVKQLTVMGDDGCEIEAFTFPKPKKGVDRIPRRDLLNFLSLNGNPDTRIDWPSASAAINNTAIHHVFKPTHLPAKDYPGPFIINKVEYTPEAYKQEQLHKILTNRRDTVLRSQGKSV